MTSTQTPIRDRWFALFVVLFTIWASSFVLAAADPTTVWTQWVRPSQAAASQAGGFYIGEALTYPLDYGIMFTAMCLPILLTHLFFPRRWAYNLALLICAVPHLFMAWLTFPPKDIYKCGLTPWLWRGGGWDDFLFPILWMVMLVLIRVGLPGFALRWSRWRTRGVEGALDRAV